MAVVNFQVEYGATYATISTVATNLQNVQLSFGRQKPLDQYNADTATVTMRYPNGYASPVALFVTGTWVRISARLDPALAFEQLWVGRIADVDVNYGMPYAGSVGNADYVTLICEGYFANFGRLDGNGYAMPAGTISYQCAQALAQTSLDVSPLYTATTPFPATTISGTWGDWINRVVLTLNGKLLDTGTGIAITNAYYKYTSTVAFSDTTNDLTNHCYEQLAFSSLADNWYTQVTVDPESYSPATVQTGSAPYRTYLVNTLNNSTSQATDYANYLLSTYKTQSLRIFAITCNLNAQIGNAPFFGQTSPGGQVRVIFRGTTYQCVVEGGSYSATPGSATATFYLSAQDLNNYLTLNDAVYGKLDNNKLGY
jgi:hypothetical protein